ncbi:uncharacterized protein LOC133844121 isoform X1 [Drosophila sulfurigaster albostrigata]|uniref:uncharacterized protein LOC133844121 isoform X1 n=1 Tax=Drosophila sulfurigaster albostrigata TaxID=89887 RepID=UPI002D219B20|nr:uncharacterized protein LOC133844121 isoform X1 [Drosophila sulfurigaster albostrigata]
MIRDVSTSTIGRDEARRPLMEAYMFQRRVLLGCSLLMVLSLIIWIVAISTDHWIIISGGTGIFIPESRRFFMSSHSGLWRHCRNSIVPNALSNAQVVRNFSSMSYTSQTLINDAKRNLSHMEFIRNFAAEKLEPSDNFTEAARRHMFAHWARGEEEEFQTYRTAFHKLVISAELGQHELNATLAKPIEINPLDVKGIIDRKTFGTALQKVKYNNTWSYYVIPEVAQLSIFGNWTEYPLVVRLLGTYIRDIGIPAYVLNDERVILILVPPKPPKGGGQTNFYSYIPYPRCKYIDMFPNSNTLRSEPGFDDELMVMWYPIADYIRTQASFACITLFVMSLGAVFSFYTFMNPRYMFKRLAGGIHLVAASTALVVLQVLFSSLDYTRTHLFYAYPDGAKLTWGYGVFLAWFTFGVNILCGLMFLWYSGKKKGAKAPNDELAMADEPTIMGR